MVKLLIIVYLAMGNLFKLYTLIFLQQLSYIVLGFTEGYVAHISTHLKEMEDEVSSDKIFSSSLEALCTNDVLYKMAAAGENIIKIYDMLTWKEIRNERIELPPSVGRVNKIEWSING